MSIPVIRIAVDVMGGDFGSSVTLPAVATALSSIPSLHVILLGRSRSYAPDQLQNLKIFGERVSFVDCADVVCMDEKPSSVLRHKQQSSLYRAVELVGRGDAQACVSAGNTGALMAAGAHLLKTFPGVDRPAVCAQIPTQNGQCLMLDLGANVDSSAEQLSQFATMGSAMAKSLYGIPAPRVGLLNIGEEDTKGNGRVKETARLLSANQHIHYVGFVEGNDIYEGKADVIVCDGFVGNIVLKASEGLARLIRHKIRQRYESNNKKNIFSRLGTFFLRNTLQDIEEQLDTSRYNGASILGLCGTVVVSHGKIDVAGFFHAIQLACQQVEQDLSRRIQVELDLSVQLSVQRQEY